MRTDNIRFVCDMHVAQFGGAIHTIVSQIDLSQSDQCGNLRTEIDLNKSEIDLNKCENVLKANLERSEIDSNWIDLNVIGPIVIFQVFFICMHEIKLISNRNKSNTLATRVETLASYLLRFYFRAFSVFTLSVTFKHFHILGLLSFSKIAQNDDSGLHKQKREHCLDVCFVDINHQPVQYPE